MINYSLFSTLHDSRVQPASSTFRQLYERLSTPPQPVTIDPSEVGFRAAKESQDVWSPAHYTPGSSRKDDNVQDNQIMVFDLDSLNESEIDEIWENLDGFESFRITSFSHKTWAKNGFSAYRMAVLLNRPVRREEWRAVWEALNEMVCNGKNDPKTKNPARIFFYGKVPTNTASEFRAEYRDGDSIDVDQLLELYRQDKQASHPPHQPLVTERSVTDDPFAADIAIRYLQLAPPATAKSCGGPGRRADTFNVALSLVRGLRFDDDTAYELLKTHYAPRCQPDLSSERIEQAIKDAVRSTSVDLEWGYLERSSLTSGTPHILAYKQAFGEVIVDALLRFSKEGQADSVLELTPYMARLQKVDQPRYQTAMSALGRMKNGLFQPLKSALLEEQLKETPVENNRIIVSGNFPSMRDATAAILAKAPNLYRHTSSLARYNDQTESFEFLKQSTVLSLLSDLVDWQTASSKDGLKKALPPDKLVQFFFENPPQEIPEIERIEGAPRFRRDTSINSNYGYDPELKAFLTRKWDLQIPEFPSKKDAEAARLRLLSLVEDFEFTDGEVGKSAWLASVLTPFVRPSWVRLAPMFAFDSSQPSSGKSTLVRIALRIAYALTEGVPVDSVKGDRLRSLIAKAEQGRQFLFLDESNDRFGFDELDALLTSGKFSGQPLYSRTQVDYDFAPTVYAAGKTMQMTPSTARRSLHIRLQRPLKTEFTISDLDDHVIKNLDGYITDALTIIAAYAAAEDKPTAPGKMPSFPDWERVIPGAIIYAGGEDPCGCRADLNNGRGLTEESPLDLLFEGWASVSPSFLSAPGLTAAQLMQTVPPGANALAATEELMMNIRAFCNLKPNQTPTTALLGSSLYRNLGYRFSFKDKNYQLTTHKSSSSTFYYLQEI